MTDTPSQNTIVAWARLMRAQHLALSAAEATLKQAGLPPLSWYDALLELERAGEEGMRPFELEAEMLLPQYGTSRLLSRLENAGYVRRRPFQGDGRGQVTTITEKGKAVRRRMWPIYANTIQAVIGDRMSEGDVRKLGTLLGKVIDR